jgi:hypothetical protein
MHRNLLRFLPGLWLLFLAAQSYAQVKLHTEDLPRFYEAFDSVMTTADTVRQLDFIQRLYVDKASTGLKEFMKLRGGNTREWRKFIETDKAALQAKRPHILSVLNQEPEILNRIKVFKTLYPNFREGDIYFCVGINNSGGTILDKTVYIGTEVAAGTTPDWAVYLVIHEFAHTQQWVQRNVNRLMSDEKAGQAYGNTHKNLLGQCISEGMADFVAELVLGQSLAERQPDGYIAFGLKHEQPIWADFKNDMNRAFDQKQGWLYGQRTMNEESMRDLGYFVGYQICKRYYQKASDKKKALTYMVELDLTDEAAKKFLAESGYDAQKK